MKSKALRDIETIEATLNGMGASTFASTAPAKPLKQKAANAQARAPSGPPPGYTYGAFGLKKLPATASQQALNVARNYKPVTLPNKAAATSVPFFDISRRGPQRDTADVFQTEQAAAQAYYQGAPGYDIGPDFSYQNYGSSEEMTRPIATLAKDKAHAARIQFVDWLKSDAPDVYGELVKRIQSGTMGADETKVMQPSLWERITGGITSLLSTYTGAKMQSEILKTNLQRAETGLPPIDAATYAPVVRTEVAVTPEMAADLRAGALGIGKNVLLWGGIAAAAFFLLKR